MKYQRCLTGFPAVCLILCAAPAAHAIEPVTLVADGYPERVGQLELENTFVAALHTPDDHRFQNYSMENELEYGIVENFTLRGKIAYFYEDSRELDGFHFDAAGIEG